MDKIEKLKNIELYLPHNLQLINSGDGRIRTMDFFDTRKDAMIGIGEWKPMLYSMYDINKNMPEHGHYSLQLILMKMGSNHKGYKAEHMQNRLDNFMKNLDFDVLPFWVVQIMLSYHFNVFHYPSDRYFSKSEFSKVI